MWSIRYRCKTFRDALWSSLPDHPQSGFLHTDAAWSSRLPGMMNPQAEQHWEVPRAGTLCTVPPRWASLYVSIVTVWPHASWLMERFRPSLCLTFLPGSSSRLEHASDAELLDHPGAVRLGDHVSLRLVVWLSLGAGPAARGAMEPVRAARPSTRWAAEARCERDSTSSPHAGGGMSAQRCLALLIHFVACLE